MVDDPEAERLDQIEEDEGGPVKSFLEHLEDLRWVLIQSAAALGVGVLICLIGANHVFRILEWPLKKAKITHSGTNQIVSIYFGTNQLGVVNLSPEDQSPYNLGTNRFVAVRVEPTILPSQPGGPGTNQQIPTRRIDDNPELAERAQHPHIDLTSLSPANSFFVAFQIGLYGGLVLASPFIFYFVVSFIFPALKLKERHYVTRGLFFGIGLFLTGVAFCYFALMPVALAASQMYSQWLGLSVFQWKADEYISFVCK